MTKQRSDFYGQGTSLAESSFGTENTRGGESPLVHSIPSAAFSVSAAQVYGVLGLNELKLFKAEPTCNANVTCLFQVGKMWAIASA